MIMKEIIYSEQKKEIDRLKCEQFKNLFYELVNENAKVDKKKYLKHQIRISDLHIKIIALKKRIQTKEEHAKWLKNEAVQMQKAAKLQAQSISSIVTDT